MGECPALSDQQSGFYLDNKGNEVHRTNKEENEVDEDSCAENNNLVPAAQRTGQLLETWHHSTTE